MGLPGPDACVGSAPFHLGSSALSPVSWSAEHGAEGPPGQPFLVTDGPQVPVLRLLNTWLPSPSAACSWDRHPAPVPCLAYPGTLRVTWYSGCFGVHPLSEHAKCLRGHRWAVRGHPLSYCHSAEHRAFHSPSRGQSLGACPVCPDRVTYVWVYVCTPHTMSIHGHHTCIHSHLLVHILTTFGVTSPLDHAGGCNMHLLSWGLHFSGYL